MTTKVADCSGDCSKKLNPFIQLCMKKITEKKLIIAAAAGFAAAMVASLKKVNPILLIVLGAVAGVAIYYLPTVI